MCLEAVKQKKYADTDKLEQKMEHIAEAALERVSKSGRGQSAALSPEEAEALLVEGDDYAFAHVLEELRTAELCLEAVKKNGYVLKFIPEELKTAELCLEAVKSNGYGLNYVPDKLKTAEMCREAAKKSDSTLEYAGVSPAGEGTGG